MHVEHHGCGKPSTKHSSMQWPSERHRHERLAIKDSLFASRILRYLRYLGYSPLTGRISSDIYISSICSVHGQMLRIHHIHSREYYSLASLSQFAWLLSIIGPETTLLVACGSATLRMLSLQSLQGFALCSFRRLRIYASQVATISNTMYSSILLPSCIFSRTDPPKHSLFEVVLLRVLPLPTSRALGPCSSPYSPLVDSSYANHLLGSLTGSSQLPITFSTIPKSKRSTIPPIRYTRYR